MTDLSAWQPFDRLLAILGIVRREGEHLIYSHQRVFQLPITPEWVAGLERDRERAERLEAFVSRFGRVQDTVADKMPPRWLAAGYTPMLIETYNRVRLDLSKRLGVGEDRLPPALPFPTT